MKLSPSHKMIDSLVVGADELPDVTKLYEITPLVESPRVTQRLKVQFSIRTLLVLVTLVAVGTSICLALRWEYEQAILHIQQEQQALQRTRIGPAYVEYSKSRLTLIGCSHIDDEDVPGFQEFACLRTICVVEFSMTSHGLAEMRELIQTRGITLTRIFSLRLFGPIDVNDVAWLAPYKSIQLVNLMDAQYSVHTHAKLRAMFPQADVLPRH